MTGLTVDRPTRGVVDDTGHRVALISRFAEPANVTAVAPARAHARLIQVDGQFPDAAPADAGRVYFVELSPLASATNEVLRRLGDAGATMPTFYVSGPNLVATMPSGVVDAGDTLASGAAVLVGATLGPCALAPREWARVLRDAMAGAGEDVASWADFLAALGNEPALYILQHTGQPPAPGQMHFDVDPGNGNIQLVTIDAHGDLAVAASPADVFAPGARIRLRTLSGGIPYHTAYDSDARSSAEPQAADAERWFAPSAFTGGVGTLLCSDLAGWFAERPAGVSLPRYHTGNHVEPLLDGIEAFVRMWDDLQLLRDPDGTGPDPTPKPRLSPDQTPYGAWLACWVFQDFELVPGEAASKFVDLVKNIHHDGTGFEVRLLGSKLVQFRGTETQEERLLMTVVMALAAGGIGGGSVLLEKTGYGASAETWVIIHLSAILIAMAASTQFVDAITDGLDGSKAVIEALKPSQPDTPRFALPSRYPATFADNPTASSVPVDVLDTLAALDRIGVWHNKMQLFALPGPPDAQAPTYVGYLGGVDVNHNRIDAWGHRWIKDYHDVHARLTGPAVADMFQTFYDRYAYDTPRLLTGEGPAAPNSCPRVTPQNGDAPTQSLSEIAPTGDHIVQIARTLYKPSAANAENTFFFAPEGETSVHDSILRAIESAREYIYLEDQFMVPPDSAGEGREIIDALEAAAGRCKALIMVFPEGTYDPQWLFGIERRNMLMARLQTSWGMQPDRYFLPLIHTKPTLGPADRISSRGRTVLKIAIDDAATQVHVADGVRVPDTPCWAWIEGELVLVRNKHTDTTTGEGTLEVVRAPNGHHHDAWARAHTVGAPVTFTKVDDIFIHAKLVLIDDAYASIGSVNMNRRSMYHDGEISAQIVPGRLRAAVDNPVRSLRCRVWGDHLGLPPDTAQAELADPLAALPLFRRPRAAGNPLVPFDLLDDMQAQGFAIETANVFSILGTIAHGLGEVGGDVLRDAIWHTIVDPTTSLDPFHDTAPFG